jgi:iron complex outermembrane receptor protein
MSFCRRSREKTSWVKICTGFRAPSLQQMYFNNSSTQFVFVGESLVPLTVGTFNSTSDVYSGLGFDKLKAEKFTALMAGLELLPVKNLEINATLFKVDVKDRIIISDRMRAWDPVFSPVFSPLGVSAAQVLFNALDTKTLAADVSLNWTVPLGGNHVLSFLAAGGWNKTEVKGDVKLPQNLEGYKATFFDRVERNYMENAQPQQRYMLRTRYQNGSFRGEIRFNYFGGVTGVESSTNPDLDQDYGGKWLTDLEFSYEIIRGIRFAAGVVNLFDMYPDENFAGISFNDIFPYPRRNAPFGFIGGIYYARLSLHF